MAKLCKRLQKAHESIDKKKLYTLEEAVKTLKAASKTKFDESFEIAMMLNIDPRKSDQNLRGMVLLPHGNGKTARVAVFARDKAAEDALKAGADIVGAEDLMEEVKKGNINFDRCIATPDMMGLVGQIGKLLGPKGLMPNPKLGTVTPNVTEAVKAAKGGQLEYRAEKEGIVHAGLGKVSFDEAKLVENIRSFISVIQRAKPASVKGTFVKAISLTTTMGPSVKVSLADLF